MEKTVLITGGTRGIGEATLRKFSEEGYAVAFIYKERDDLAKALMSEIPNTLGRKIDLSSPGAGEELNQFVKDALIYFGVKSFNVCVINAGISMMKLFPELSEMEIVSTLDTNLRGAVMTARAVTPRMIEEKKGSIVIVSSIWGEKGGAMEAVYSATKHGTLGLGKSLASELGPSGIRVNMVTPGVIDTDMSRGELDPRTMEIVKQSTPLGRVGRPDEVAEAIYFLAEEKASFITGSVLTIDGGFSI